MDFTKIVNYWYFPLCCLFHFDIQILITPLPVWYGQTILPKNHITYLKISCYTNSFIKFESKWTVIDFRHQLTKYVSCLRTGDSYIMYCKKKRGGIIVIDLDMRWQKYVSCLRTGDSYIMYCNNKNVKRKRMKKTLQII